MRTKRIDRLDTGPTQYFHLISLLLLLLISSGCGKPSPEGARRELAKLGKDYSPSEFVKSAGNGDKMAVELLIGAGMDVNVKDEKGLTALAAAAATGQNEVVALLLANKADVGAETTNRYTPLMLALENGQSETVALLIQADAFLHERAVQGDGSPAFGWGALAFAVKRGNPQMLKLLLEKGACPYGGIESTAQDACNEAAFSGEQSKKNATEILTMIREFKQSVKPQFAASRGKYVWPGEKPRNVELTGNGFFLELPSDQMLSEPDLFTLAFPYRVNGGEVEVLTGTNTVMEFKVDGQDLVSSKTGMRFKRVQN